MTEPSTSMADPEDLDRDRLHIHTVLAPDIAVELLLRANVLVSEVLRADDDTEKTDWRAAAERWRKTAEDWCYELKEFTVDG